MGLIRKLLAALVVFVALGAPPAAADFVVELTAGGIIHAESWVEREGKIVLYRPSGELIVDRAAVKSIRERVGEHVIEPESRKGVAETAPVAPAAAVAGTEDLAERERAVTRDVILAHRDLLFARNRGESGKDLEKRQKSIEELEQRRAELQKKLKTGR